MKLRTLSESSGYSANMQDLGDVERLDDVLTGLTLAIAKSPAVFDKIAGLQGTFRVASSTPIKQKDGTSAIFNILFQEVSDDVIEMLYLEKIICE